ncbi:MAG: hypothetical protein HRU80_10805 [Ignavibacteriales bacterium]|nr:MAG: hypothetical protein HRU80_10805 [Ignavibacteriales bacterium]
MMQKNPDLSNLSAAEFQPVFPIETEYTELPVNTMLSALACDIEKGENEISIMVVVPPELHEINLICLVNDVKYDLYFNISEGRYKFIVPLSTKVRKISILYYNRVIRSKEQVIYLK